MRHGPHRSATSLSLSSQSLLAKQIVLLTRRTRRSSLLTRFLARSLLSRLVSLLLPHSLRLRKTLLHSLFLFHLCVSIPKEEDRSFDAALALSRIALMRPQNDALHCKASPVRQMNQRLAFGARVLLFARELFFFSRPAFSITFVLSSPLRARQVR